MAILMCGSNNQYIMEVSVSMARSEKNDKEKTKLQFENGCLMSETRKTHAQRKKKMLVFSFLSFGAKHFDAIELR